MTLDSCPDITEVCPELFVTYYSVQDSDSCDGTFEILSTEYGGGPNIYYSQKTSGSIYLYFSVSDFRWICSSSLEETSAISGQCLTNLSDSEYIEAYSLEPGWDDFTFIKQWNDMPWSSGGKNNTVYINCASGSPTESPTPSPTIDYSVSSEDTELLREELKTAFDDSGSQKPLLSATVRLVFNDCIGPREHANQRTTFDNTKTWEYDTVCDGCIDIDDAFHSGLYEDAILELESIYTDSENEWHQKVWYSSVHSALSH